MKLAVPSSLRLLVSTPGLGAVIELSGGSVAEHEKIVLAGLESPQGLAFAKRGDGWGLYAVFVSDDTAGAIYKLVPPG